MNPISDNNDGNQELSHVDEAVGYAALSRIVVAGRPLEETLDEVAILAKRVLLEAPEASVTLVTEEQARTAAFSGDVALQLDERQYDEGYGPCLDAATSGGFVQVTMDAPGSPYPNFRRLAQQQGVTHSLSVGLPAAGRTIGALNLYTKAGQPFTDDSTRIAGTFAGIAGIVLATHGRDEDAANTARQLQQALQSRAVISQAQGILMAQHHYNQDEAFAALLRLSQQQGMKLQHAAQTLVDRTAST